MTIDERIQALTESVELLASFHKDMEQKFNAAMQQIAEVLKMLGTVIADHEMRLRKLEGN